MYIVKDDRPQVLPQDANDDAGRVELRARIWALLRSPQSGSHLEDDHGRQGSLWEELRTSVNDSFFRSPRSRGCWQLSLSLLQMRKVIRPWGAENEFFQASHSCDLNMKACMRLRSKVRQYSADVRLMNSPSIGTQLCWFILPVLRLDRHQQERGVSLPAR